jgi:hypothetical protein
VVVVVRPEEGLRKERKGVKECGGGGELGLGFRFYDSQATEEGRGSSSGVCRRWPESEANCTHDQGTPASCAGPQISAVEGGQEGIARHRGGPRQGGSASTLLPPIPPLRPPLLRWRSLVDSRCLLTLCLTVDE